MRSGRIIKQLSNYGHGLNFGQVYDIIAAKFYEMNSKYNKYGCDVVDVTVFVISGRRPEFILRFRLEI